MTSTTSDSGKAKVHGGSVPAPGTGRIVAGRFELLSLLGRSHGGELHRARQIELGRECAVRLLAAGADGDRLEAASAVSRVNHPNLVSIFDFGVEPGGTMYLAMELLHGDTLQQLLARRRRLPWRRAVSIASQVCRGLRAAHAVGIVHRDLKPASIFLASVGDERDHVKLVDFGLADDDRFGQERLREAGPSAARYAAPEQLAFFPVDGRADVYALGVVLYEMITGRVPFDSTDANSIVQGHVHDAPPPFAVTAPDVECPRELEAVVMQCLAKRPEGRYGSAAELLMALGNALPGLSSTGASLVPPLPSVVPPTLTGAVPDLPLGRTSQAHSLAPRSPEPSPARRWGLFAAALALGGAVSAWAVSRNNADVSPAPTTVAAPPPVLEPPPAAPVLEPTAAATPSVAAAPTAEPTGAEAGATPRGTVRPSAREAAPREPAPRTRAAAAPAASTGRLFVWINSGTCRAAVDGVDRGTVPTGALELAPGEHTVICTLRDGSTKTAHATVEAGKSTSVRFTVER
jgi:serine/threonine-protein kinase